MVLLLLAGLALLGIWTAWALYIAEKQRPVKVSLMLQVQHGERFLDPFLRLLCQLLSHSSQIEVGEIWILAEDDGQQVMPIVERLNHTYPFFRFRSGVKHNLVDFDQAEGQLLLFLDLTDRLTPLAALQAVAQLLTNGPTPIGTAALPTGG
jgi:hypothetical protein